MSASSTKPVITRKVTFHSENLGQDVTFVFLFDDYDTKHDAPITSHPVVWKKVFFSKTGNRSKSLEYTNQLTLTKPDDGDLKFHFPETNFNAIFPIARECNSVWHPFKPGRPLFLHQINEGNDFQHSTPEPEPEPSTTVHGSSSTATGLVLQNKSGQKVDAVLGFQERVGSLPQAVRVFRNVGDGCSINMAGFKPVLRVYATSSYREGEVLLEAIPGQPIWSQNLDELASQTEWRITYDGATGKFSVAQTG